MVEEKDKVIIICEKCKGSGRDGSWRNGSRKKCYVCNGKGVLKRFTRTEQTTTRCPCKHCGGSGTIVKPGEPVEVQVTTAL